MAKSEDELRRLELEERLQEAIKRSTENLGNFADAQKKIVENYKIAQKIQLQINAAEEDINELIRQGKKETDEEIKLLRKRQAALQQDKNLIIQINKELSSTKNLLKSTVGSMMDGAKALKNYFIPSLSDVFSKFLEIDNIAHQTANTLGFQGDRFKFMQDNLTITRDAFVDMGFSVESAYKAQTALSDATGRQVMLTKQASVAMAETARITGMEVEELAGMTGQMEAFGLGAEQSADIILQMSRESAQMGLNSGKVIKKFEQNLNLLNKLNFKNGVQGLKEMAKFSEKYKIDMQAVASVADKVFRPEGAIEAAAQLQVLGGSLASLGDPFTLMYKARNSPEELAKSLTKAAIASATFNSKTGEFEVNAHEMDRLREAAQALGMDYSHLVEVAKQGAKVGKFEGLLGGKGLDKETMDALVGAAQMGKDGAFLTINGNEVLLKDITKEQAAMFKEDQSKRDELAKKAMSIQNNFDAIKNELMVALVKVFEGVDWKSVMETLKSVAGWIKNAIDWLRETFSPTGLLLSGLAIYFGGKAVWAFIQGRIFGSSAAAAFNTGTMGGGVKGGIMSKIFGGKTKEGGPGWTPTGVPGQFREDATGEIAQNNPSNMTKGMDMGNMVKGAAAVLILSGALFVFGKALQELDKVTNKGETIAMAAAGLITLGLTAQILSNGSAQMILGAAAVVVLSGALYVLGSAMQQFNGIDWGTMAKAGVAIVGFSAAMFGLGALLFAGGGLGALLFGAGVAGFLALGVALNVFGEGLTKVTDPIERVSKIDSSGLGKTIDAINRVDTDKLEALKELSLFMSLLGATTTIKFDETLKVSGSIEVKGEAGGRSSMDLVNNDSFVRALSTKLAKTKVESRNQKS